LIVLARSKFTEERRQRVLAILSTGGSRRMAATYADIGHQTLSRWLARGAKAPQSSRCHESLHAVEAAEAAPSIRALKILYDVLPDRPDLAWKFIERREPGYAGRLEPESPERARVIDLTIDGLPPPGGAS
jgi:hypothetical protein